LVSKAITNLKKIYFLLGNNSKEKRVCGALALREEEFIE